MNARAGLIAGVALAASLAPVAPAHAAVGDSITCVFSLPFSTTPASYSFSTAGGGSAMCGGIVAGAPRVATDIQFNSSGVRVGDMCVLGTLTDSDPSISSASQGMSVTGASYT